MALWAIGDFHLSFQVPEKSMDIFGRVWVNHEKKIVKHFNKLVKPEDTVVITGDHTWGHRLDNCKEDMDFIKALPGRKILLRGNHDMFWNAKRTDRLNEMFNPDLYFLQNNYYTYKAKDGVCYALVGTKGYCYEGLDTIEHYEKIMKREVERLQTSFDMAVADGYKNFIMFLHYPPTSIGEQESLFTIMAEKYNVRDVIYSHCHGIDRFDDSFKGNVNGVEYWLVSGDYLKFKPVKIID